jgi:3-hydroxyacyl-[acyl-carrier-protein] dehydratase
MAFAGEHIPHRHPFLFASSVNLLEEGGAEGFYEFTNSHPVLRGHFPGNPIVPGVLLVDGMAQVAGCFLSMSKGPIKSCYLSKVESAEFFKVLHPGEPIRYEVSLLKERSGFYWFKGKVELASEALVAEATIKAYAELV